MPSTASKAKRFSKNSAEKISLCRVIVVTPTFFFKSLLCFRLEQRGFFVVLSLLIICATAGPGSASVAGIIYTIKDHNLTVLVATGISDADQPLRALLAQRKLNNFSALRNAFDSLGYFSFTIDSSAHDTVVCNAAERSSIATIVMRGALPLTIDSFGTGGPLYWFDRGRIAALAAYIVRRYADAGYPFTTVSLSLTTAYSSANHPAMTVTYTAISGVQAEIASIVFIDTPATDRAVLKRDLGLKPGSLFSQSALEQSIERLQRRSYIIAAYALPPLILNDTTLPIQRPHHRQRLLVPVAVTDRHGLSFDGAATLSTNSAGTVVPAGAIEFSLVNMLHQAEAVALSYKGDARQQTLGLNAKLPWVVGLPLFADGEFGLEIRQDSYGYLQGALAFSTEIFTNWYGGVTLRAHETTIANDTVLQTWDYGGADLTLAYAMLPPRRGRSSAAFSLAMGSGLARNNSAAATVRWQARGAAGFQVALFTTQAVAYRVLGATLLTTEQNLPPTELNRAGGSGSLRGYSDNEISNRSIVFNQLEYMVYFSPQSRIYAFSDGGAGFNAASDLGDNSYRILLGYGLGISAPTPAGILTVEWARNWQDTRSIGRIHVGLKTK